MTASAELTEAEVQAWAYENPRPELHSRVPRSARRVLDLGCASGAVGAGLKEWQPIEVIGVELDARLAEKASSRLDRVITADLEELFARADLAVELGRFDCLLAGDVLEHLRDPWMVLSRAVELLEPGGTAIVSLPNVRHWDVLWTVGVRGVWPQRPQGIFDRTHLRWFTAADGMELLIIAGLIPEQVHRVYSLRAVSGPHDRLAARLAKWPLRPFFVLQHIWVGHKPGEGEQALTPTRPIHR